MSILQWEDQIGMRNVGSQFSTQIWYSFLSLAHFINSRQLLVFLAVDLYLLSRSLVKVKVEFC